jgi:amino acid transporter
MPIAWKVNFMPHKWRKVLFGQPLATHQSHHQKLPKYLALSVFSSDAISSVAYATEECILALVLGGVAAGAALSSVFPISIAIAVLLAIVVFSYRQTIHAYPRGGGSYIVAKENLGTLPGLVAGAALSIDYILTVAVSVAAGVAAIISALPELAPYRVTLCLGFIALLTIANLRGLKESGTLFMAPTYSFLVCLYILIGVGLYRYFTGDLGHYAAAEQHAAEAAQPLTLFLFLKAFSSGCAAMTGTEAVSDGVPAFRPPEPRNAAATLTWMACILGSLFLGISFLAWHYGAVPPHDHSETVLSILAGGIFGRGWFYYVVQAATCSILIVAANTAYADFPRLQMFLARDRFLPRQLANIGDRLVFSNGILLLAAAAGILVIAFQGITHHLIPLYAVGVFLSFTLSQAGMVRRWFRLKEQGWQRSAAINAFGAACTFLVLAVIAATKFIAGEPVDVFPLTTPLGLWAIITGVGFVLISMYHRWMGKWLLGISALGFLLWWAFSRANVLAVLHIPLGAWLVVVIIPIMVWIASRIHNHYGEVASRLTMEEYEPVPEFRHTVLITVPGVHRGIMPALQYARSMGGDVRAVYVEIEPERTPEVLKRWQHWVPDIPLVVLESHYRSMIEPLLDYIDQVERERDDDIVTVVIPEFVTEKWWTKLLHNQNGLLLKWALLFKKGVVVTNIRYYLDGAVELGGHPLAGVSAKREMGK